MKTIIFFLFSIQLIFAQLSGEAFYIKTSHLKLNKTADQLENLELGSSIKSINSKIGDAKYILKFNDSLAVFEEEQKMISNHDNELAYKLSKIFVGYYGKIYYDLINGLTLSEREVLGTDLLIERKISDYNWIISKEKIKINDIICFKATTNLKEEGRNGIKHIEIVAWFAPDINVNAGPDGFFGLPGLIIQIEKGKILTTLKSLKFSEENVEITIPENNKIMTNDEFQTLMKDMALNRRKYYNKD